MKSQTLTIIVTFCLFNITVGQNNFSDYLELMKSKVIKSYSLNLNDDNVLDEIVFKYPSNSDHPDFGYSDPGVFNVLEINISNCKPFVLEGAFDSLALPIRKDNHKILQSTLIYLTYDVEGSKYLLISGPGYGCCLPKLFILKILSDRIEITHNDEFEVTEFTYNINNKNYYVTGYSYLGEVWGGYKTHYEFKDFNYQKVYKLTNGLTLDRQKTYNLNKQKIDLYGEFLNYSEPVFVINKETDEKILVDFSDEIEDLYQLKYHDLSRSKLNEKYFRRFNKSELRLMRNEIFASYGYIFSSPDLRDYFEKKKWYKPVYKNVNDKLTVVEKYNIKLIQSIENAP